jgi:uncharacterized protein YbjT (DUF2867 family)
VNELSFDSAPPHRVLVAGATGYVGRRLVGELVARGLRVRCLARTPEKLDAEPWRADVEVVSGDILERASLARSFRDIDVAYYLIHSIGSGADWQQRDRRAAENFRDAAADAGIAQIVYLGGLGDDAGGALSPHLASRHEVGRVLAAGPVPVTELRAAVVIGSGSASFEMLRHLVEVLPVMTTPRWVQTRVQPIAVRDVLAYLTGVLGNRAARGEVFEIGGADVVTYREMMDTYAQVAGLGKRVIVPVPVLSPRLSSLWVGLVTPIPADLARPLIDSLVNEVVVHDHAIDNVVPHHPIGCRAAVELALRRVGELDEREWTPADPVASDPEWAGATILSDCQIVQTRRHPRRCTERSARWAATAVGSSVTGCGRSAAGWIVSSAVSVCAAAASIRPSCGSGMSSTSGESKRSTRRSRSGSAPKCAHREMRGSSGRSNPAAPKRARRSSSAPSSARAGSSVARTGTRSRRFTGSSSGRWPGESSRAPRQGAA